MNNNCWKISVKRFLYQLRVTNKCLKKNITCNLYVDYIRGVYKKYREF